MTLGRILRRMGLPLWTFLGIGISAVWFNTLSVLMEDAFSSGLASVRLRALAWLPRLLVFLTPFLFLVVVWLWQRKAYALSRLGFFEGQLEQPDGKKGLILLISNPLHSQFAIDYHRNKQTLSTVWLIPSNDEQAVYFGMGTEEVAKKLREYCEERKLSSHIMPAVAAGDAQETFDLVNRIYRNLGPKRGLAPVEIVSDFTGGTKPMAVGMIMACLPADRQLEYVPFNPETRQSNVSFRQACVRSWRREHRGISAADRGRSQCLAGCIAGLWLARQASA